MYGTVAKLRVNPTNMSALYDLAEKWDRAPGQMETIIFQSDADPNEIWLVAIFESETAYTANAVSPEQHERYLQMRALLDADPEWNDGAIVQRITY